MVRSKLEASYLIGSDVVGADTVYTDKATVKSVQSKLKKLSNAAGSAYDPGPIDGIIGPRTRSAVEAFNKSYGWPSDGSNITAGTLEALKRPDVMNPPKLSLPATPASAPTAAASAAASSVVPSDANEFFPSLTSSIQPATPQAKKTQPTTVPWRAITIGSILIAGGGLILSLLHGGKKRR